jgi:short-subunit dehydrogenase
VNNAGFGTHAPFEQEDPEQLRSEIALDVQVVAELTRTFIGDLRAADCGVLINVASMAAYTPVPGMAVYGAAKAFVLSFTEALWYEHRGTGLRVLALSPGATETEFFDTAGPEAAAARRLQTPREVVETALLALGRLAGRKRSVMLMGRLTASAATTAQSAG